MQLDKRIYYDTGNVHNGKRNGFNDSEIDVFRGEFPPHTAKIKMCIDQIDTELNINLRNNWYVKKENLTRIEHLCKAFGVDHNLIMSMLGGLR